MRRLLGSGAPPDAVFCFNDLLALGALRALHEAGLRVPEDVAVVGFDDIEDGRYSAPTLTTVAPDKDRIARPPSTCSPAGWPATGTRRHGNSPPRDRLTPRESTT